MICSYSKKLSRRSFAFLFDKNHSESYSEEDESSFKTQSFIVYAQTRRSSALIMSFKNYKKRMRSSYPIEIYNSR